MSTYDPNQSPDANANQDKQDGSYDRFKAVKKRRRVGKQLIIGSFGTVFITAAFSIHTWPAIPFAIAGITCASWVLYMELQNRSFAHPIPIRWAISLAGCAIMVWMVVHLAQMDDPNPESPLPRFNFSMAVSSAPDDVQLTNSFLLVEHFGSNLVGKTTAHVLIPHTGISNVTLNLRARVSAYAETVEVTVSVPPGWRCNPGEGWLATKHGNSFIDGSGKENIMQSWVCWWPRPVLAGNGIGLPSFFVNEMEIKHQSLGISFVGLVFVQARAKHFPTAAVAFELGVMDTNDLIKPIAIIGTNVGAYSIMMVPQEQLRK